MTYLDLDNWNRAAHFDFYSKFEEPFFGVTANIDCTLAYAKCKTQKFSFYNFYLHKILTVVNHIENFRYRIHDHKIAIHDQINVSATVMRTDKSFGFSLITYDSDFRIFNENVVAETARIQTTTGLFTREFTTDNVIHFSALPWINFTSLSHARSYRLADSCPKISVGRISLSGNEQMTLPISIHAHHALIDGYHVGLFFENLQEMMNQ